MNADKLLAGIQDLLGHTGNGEVGVVTLFQDDATQDFYVKVGKRYYSSWSFVDALEMTIKGEKDD